MPKPVAYDYERQCWVQYVGKAAQGDDQFPDREEVWKVTRCGHLNNFGFDCYACKHRGERITYPKGGPGRE